jgi:hypothetical protein
LFFKEKFAVDFLYQECCYEFDLLSKGSNSLKEYAAVEGTFHYDQEVDDSQSDSQGVDTFDILSNVSCPSPAKQSCTLFVVIPYPFLPSATHFVLTL